MAAVLIAAGAAALMVAGIPNASAKPHTGTYSGCVAEPQDVENQDDAGDRFSITAKKCKPSRLAPRSGTAQDVKLAVTTTNGTFHIFCTKATVRKKGTEVSGEDCISDAHLIPSG
ncbi:hypothetical protein [Nocardia sp. XZ_19_385]|uniref:hypothetical protein n=1 Tax=Nocardia sp. XZ_19_385 TaxID=2769488 RepID=UPI00188ECFF5|nr:hypothetical protein [Nocardia sp. XZ_19_385]